MVPQTLLVDHQFPKFAIHWGPIPALAPPAQPAPSPSSCSPAAPLPEALMADKIWWTKANLPESSWRGGKGLMKKLGYPPEIRRPWPAANSKGERVRAERCWRRGRRRRTTTTTSTSSRVSDSQGTLGIFGCLFLLHFGRGILLLRKRHKGNVGM